MSTPTIAGEHGVRVTATWLNSDDLFPTYIGLLQKHTTGEGTPGYTGLVTDYADYRTMLDNAGSSTVDVTEDLTCDVAGLRIRRGRDSIAEPVKAGTLTMTLNDDTGRHDPRRPPAGPSRSGSKIVVEVDPGFAGTWIPLFTGFVESWGRRIDAADGTHSEISVDAADAFSLLARAVPRPPENPVGADETGAARIERLLDAGSWVGKWGERNLQGGLVPMSSTKLDNRILEDCQGVTRSEDGIFHVTADGVITWNDRYWRGSRRTGVAVMNITGTDPVDEFPDMARLCPSRYDASDDDLDLVNRAIVWRNRDTDPDKPSGGRPEPVKKVSASTPESGSSISAHGIQAKEYPNLPHRDDTNSQELADRLVARLGAGTNNVGEFQIPLTGHHNDAATIATLEWGDQIIVWDDTVTGTPAAYPFELVGVEHSITPAAWMTTVSVDRWNDEYLPALGVVPGKPGHFTPPASTIPADLATLQALGALGETTGWADGEFVWLADGSRAYWTGSSWAKGAKNDPTGVVNGTPGSFTPAGSATPLNFAVLLTLGTLGETLEWPPGGEHVVLADTTTAWWDGTQWIPGVSPTKATAGSPGTYDPPGSFATIADLDTVAPQPAFPWAEGQYVPLTGTEPAAHWNGQAWIPGVSPGYGTAPGRWGAANWGANTWISGI